MLFWTQLTFIVWILESFILCLAKKVYIQISNGLQFLSNLPSSVCMSITDSKLHDKNSKVIY